VTLVTVLSIVVVVSVYAVLIGTFTGGDVTVGGMGLANVRYSSDNTEAGTWTPTLSPTGTGVPWYSRLEIPAAGYSGPVTITWHLEQKNATWTDVPSASTSTSMLLTGGTQNIYATTNGLWAAGNQDWGANSTQAGTYRVIVDVQSA
jgi:hypothetical protein